MRIRSLLRSAAPTLALEIVRTKRDLAASPGASLIGSWVSAFSPGVRSAVECSRYSLLPLWLRRPLSFVIDVGANEGQWLSSLLRLLPIEAVWVFEPNPEAMQKCRLRLRHRSGLDFKEIALGSAPGNAVLHVTKASVFSSFLQPNQALIEANYPNHPATIVAEREVRVESLDELLPAGKHVDLLKIDVQGLEREVLCGARKTLQNTKAVLLEVNFRSHYEGDATFGPLHSLMRDLGFELWSIAPPCRGPSGEALWADALFLNAETLSPTGDNDRKGGLRQELV
jgi:FkbM family methyltransferase